MKRNLILVLAFMLAIATVGCSDNNPFDTNSKATGTKSSKNTLINSDRVGMPNGIVTGTAWVKQWDPDAEQWIYVLANHARVWPYDLSRGISYYSTHSKYSGTDGKFTIVMDDLEGGLYCIKGKHPGEGTALWCGESEEWEYSQHGDYTDKDVYMGTPCMWPQKK